MATVIYLFTYDILLSLLPPIPSVAHFKTNHTASVSAFYTCHRQVTATDKVLRYFRRQYPRSSVYLFNDAGAPFVRYLARKYRAHYVYHPVHTVSTSAGKYWNSSDKAWVYVSDLLHTAVDSQSDWIILLEDDTLVLNRISTWDLHFDMNGVNPDRYQYGNEDFFWYRVVQKHIHDSNASYSVHWGYNGCGGTVFRGSFLRRLAANVTRLKQQVETFARLSLVQEGLKSMPSDQLLSFLVQINGGSMGTNQHYLEPWWGHALLSYASGDAEILHGDKSTYSFCNKIKRCSYLTVWSRAANGLSCF